MYKEMNCAYINNPHIFLVGVFFLLLKNDRFINGREQGKKFSTEDTGT